MRTVLALAVCLTLLSAATVRAEVRIAVFNLQKVVAESDVLKEAQTVIKKEFDPRRTALEKEKTELQKLAESLNGSVPTEEQRKSFITREQGYGQKANAFLSDFQKAELRVRSDVDRVIVAAAANYAKKKGYDLIIDNAAVVYAAGLLDVTTDMLSEANAQWRAMKKK
ncbi:MAG: OmpH family outer membrane protein [Desulfovibrio sp.]|jgi:outer membrane protein|nr:OmpH family outer membrane protein [Desulfovibrio sp.]